VQQILDRELERQVPPNAGFPQTHCRNHGRCAA
jgi:hypothetical protein